MNPVILSEAEEKEVVGWMYAHLEHGSVTEPLYRKLLHLEEKEYIRKQMEGSEKVPGKVYRWDCVTISDKCLACPHYHSPSTGEDPHDCPYGLKQRLRRIG